MIAGIDRAGGIYSLFPQYTAYKVDSIKKVRKIDENENTSIFKENFPKSSSVSLSLELKYAQSISYTENPYDQSKRMADSTLLLGQNFDVAV